MIILEIPKNEALFAVKKSCAEQISSFIKSVESDYRYTYYNLDTLLDDFNKCCDEIINATKDNFKDILKKNNILQRDLAEYAGISQQAVSYMIIKNFNKKEYTLKTAVIFFIYSRLADDLLWLH